MRNQNTPVALEGIPFLAVAGAATLVLILLTGRFPLLAVLAVLALVLTLFIAFFFRNPQRLTPADERSVVAPADGVVIYCGPAREEYSGEEMLKISIFMSVFNVHINRVPVTGRVADTFYRSGKFLDVRDERATFENERLGMVLDTVAGARLVVVQVAGLIARRIVCYAKEGDSLRRGERYGLIRFGSRLDVYLPLTTELKVALGNKTVAGETVLGILA
ncbi:phosphatidylserine decarboxylase family protein [Geomobilimonas luticola]|uniref:Phosphatidylserine decarboxylase proenzyme n=1 Tax=Geomobilimonas luticola TaxID=1114878 RepID=A0ABS5SFX1_9BACT|nr:phosphatidylserine decarboxylase family protein [Geomobilimonas luticola]MBT0654261.1 phosphatidylserine decarboxylase family protein [Geomobilimonas luticola]